MKKAADDSDDDDSDDSDESDSDEEPPAKKATPAIIPKKAAAVPVAAAKKAVAKEESSDDSSDDDDDSEEEEPPKKAAPVATKKPATPAPTPAKKVAAKEESSDDEDEDDDEEEEEPVKVTKPAASAKPAAAVAAPAPGPSGEIGAHKAYVKGLPWKATEKEITDFFKATGKPTKVELPLDGDGRSTGTAYVFFAKRAELDAALELDGQYWPGTERWLKIQEGVEKPARASFGGPKPEGCNTVFVGNLPWDVEEEQVRELFSTVGEIENVRFATLPEDGSFRGFGHVQFVNGDDTEAAVAKLQGALINGKALRIDYAPPRNRDSSGGGGGRGGRGDGGRGGGRGGGKLTSLLSLQ